jgi:hypothetical protein
MFRRVNSERELSDLCYIFSNGAWKMNRRIFQLESGAGFVCVRAQPPVNHLHPPPPPTIIHGSEFLHFY